MKLIYAIIFSIMTLSSAAYSQYAVKIISPNGGEKLQVGKTVEIKWEGIQPYQEVSLDYSINNGATWKNITPSATGLKYQWTVPNDASTQCLIKAIVINPISPAQWIRTAIGADEDEIPVDIRTDRKGNIYTCGVFGAPVIDFGNGPISHPDSNQGIYLTKYDPAGKLLWVRTFMRKGNSWPRSMTIDTSGNIYIRGYMGAFDFGNNVILNDLPYINAGDWQWFLASFDPDGNARWAKMFSGSIGEVKNSLVCDSTGSLYACGSFNSDTVDFGNGVILINSDLSPDPGIANPSNEYIVKFNLNGKALWARRINRSTESSSGGIGVSKVTSDGTGNLTVTGGYSKEYADFGDGVVLKNSSIRNNNYISQYTSDGRILWAKNIESSAKSFFPIIESLTHDSFKNIYICGNFESPSLDFGKGIILKNTSFSKDGFIAKYDKSGNIIWAKSIQGDNDDYIASIETDEFGEVYVTGSTSSYELNLGNNITMKTISFNGFDFFIAKFNKAGNALWYKRAVGNHYDHSFSLAIDGAKNLIITGSTFSTELNCGTGEILQRSKKSEADLFVAKYTSDAPFGVEDISDANWTINKPEFSALNIDMGRVLLGTKKDSVITAFIRNEGDFPVDVRDIQLSGVNASEFTIVSVKPPFIIPVDGEEPVEFRFTPSSIGVRQANLTIITPFDNGYQIIQGEGVQPLISIAASLVDMGVVEIGSQKDTILTAIVENVGNAPLTITSITLFGAGKNAYTLVNSPGSFILEVGNKQNIELRFSPQTIGEASAELQFSYEGMTSGPAIAQITGFGIGGGMYIENDSAFAGEERHLKIKLNKLTAHNLLQQKPVSFTAKVTYSNSIIAPLKNTSGITITNNDALEILNISSQWNGKNDEIASIPFIATLGDRTSTTLELLSFNWLNDAGEILNYDTELQNGVFKILGICEEGGERLYDINGKAQMMMVAPHPANGVVKITFESIELGATRLALTDILGQQTVLKEGDFEKGSHSFELDTEDLAPGMFILTMQTPTQIFTQQVIIGK